MGYLGANIYYWGESEQDRLLLTGLHPWALETRRSGLAKSFWFSRCDARGPHIFALFRAGEGAREQLRAFLEREIGNFCSGSPSRTSLSTKDLQQRHRECRGKILCAADRGEDLSTNNSFVVFDHEAGGYPLWLASGMPSDDEFWTSMDALTFWTLAKLAAGRNRTVAVSWLAAIDRALESAGLPAEAYWRYHAASLVPGLKKLGEVDPHEISSVLRTTIGEHNSNLLSQLWSEPKTDFDVNGLVKIIASAACRTIAQHFQVLREITHTVLGRLVHTVDVQIPMVLYTWRHSLSR